MDEGGKGGRVRGAMGKGWREEGRKEARRGVAGGGRELIKYE